MLRKTKNIVIIVLLFVIYKMIKISGKERQKLNDAQNTLYLLKEWMTRRNEGIKISSYFIRNGYKNVIIYGAGTYGETLMRDLRDSGVNIRFFINTTSEYFNVGYPVILLNELKSSDINEKDIIVVTPIEYYANITKNLRKITDCTIVSLEEVVNLC